MLTQDMVFCEMTDPCCPLDTIARLALYQLGLSAPEYLPLLNFAINTNTLADSMVVIVLDWSKPWGFVESLQRWAKVLEGLIDNVCKEGKAQSEHGWSRGQALVDELKEKGKMKEL
jgi:dynein light intermediate chain 1